MSNLIAVPTGTTSTTISIINSIAVFISTATIISIINLIAALTSTTSTTIKIINLIIAITTNFTR